MSDDAWSNLLGLDASESCLATLRVIQDLQSFYRNGDAVTPPTSDRPSPPPYSGGGLQRNRPGDCWDQISEIRFERLSADLEQLKWRLETLFLVLKLDKPPERWFDMNPIEWDVETQGWCQRELEAERTIKGLLESVGRILRDAIDERKELPLGWEDNAGRWPNVPIRDVGVLREWLDGWLIAVWKSRSNEWATPESYLEDIRRELRNARRAARAWSVEVPPSFDDNPADIHEAERQLELLIDQLTVANDSPDDVPPPAAPSSGAKAVDDAGSETLVDDAEWDRIERELLDKLTPKLKTLFPLLWKYRNVAVRWKELRDAYSGSTSVRAIQEALKTLPKRVANCKLSCVNVAVPSTVERTTTVTMTVVPRAQKRAEK